MTYYSARPTENSYKFIKAAAALLNGQHTANSNCISLLSSSPEITVFLLDKYRYWLKTKLQYCAKVMQAKSTNFVLCSPDVSSKVRAKIQVQIRGA